MTEMAKALSKEIEKNERLEKQLTEARAIIRDLLAENKNNCFIFNDNRFMFNSDYINRAEAFLKEAADDI